MTKQTDRLKVMRRRVEFVDQTMNGLRLAFSWVHTADGFDYWFDVWKRLNRIKALRSPRKKRK